MLFDLETDPAERHDVSDRYPGQLRSLADDLRRFRSRPRAETPMIELSTEEAGALEALVYTQ